MSDVNLIRWSGVTAVIGGFAMAAYMLIHPWAQRTGDIATTLQWFVSHAFHLVGALLLVLGLVGLYARQRKQTGKPGLFSFLLAYLGTALFVATGVTSSFLWPAIAAEAPAFVADGGGMFSHPMALGPILAARVFLVLGYVWFGFVSFRAGVLPRGASLLVMVGVVGMNLPTPPVGPVPWLATVIGALVFCFGMVSWGWALWSQVPDAEESPIEFLNTSRLLVGTGVVAVLVAVAASISYGNTIRSCFELVQSGLPDVATDRSLRFLGKVPLPAALCRGGETALEGGAAPWVDWSNYYATADANSLSGTWLDPLLLAPLERNGRGMNGALIDLEYQRLELVQFNLFDNSGTYPAYVNGRATEPGPTLRWWPEMQLGPDHPNYDEVGGDSEQVCTGDLIRWRTVPGICNDIFNPAMGSSGMLFARNVQFENTFPRLGHTQMLVDRHGDRLGLLQPDPQVISRILFTREQSDDAACNQGRGLADRMASNCDYTKAPFFNVLAAFWIQFMTHDWFSHLIEGQNAPDSWMGMGCPEDRAAQLGCRPGDRIDQAMIAEHGPPPTFGVEERYERAYMTTRNNVTAWWDASQIYGYDETSLQRVKRDPDDPAKLLMVQVGDRTGAGEQLGYLPLLAPDDPQLDQWSGQEAVAFPDNFNIGLTFYHNVFAREHNLFVDAFRQAQAATPNDDSGLRNPDRQADVITYAAVTDEELYQVARMVVSAEIAKIHTIEWTTQLLYDEPLYRAMNANWGGLFDEGSRLSEISERIRQGLANSDDPNKRNLLVSVFASGSGIVGSGSRLDDPTWDMLNPRDVNGGVSHFGSPFNFPEEFTTVYRLHPLVPDLIEFREVEGDPNSIQTRIPVVETAFDGAVREMRARGLADWALSMGRQRLGLLALGNHPQFLQNLTIPRLESETQQIDVVALDIIRDRERGISRFNEFRRQYGLRQFTSFEELAGPDLADELEAIYGTHVCDESKIITETQRYQDGAKQGQLIDDCLGFPHGTEVDNIEDVDVVVGWLAEVPSMRPHGFAISETQFHVFIINASRRLFSDRFFTSSFRPEFYTYLGHSWVMNNGPGQKQYEPGAPNGHENQEVSPMKRVLLRVLPELGDQLAGVINVFDPWARDRGEYYCLDWKPRVGAESDPAFANWEEGPLACTDM